MNTLMNMNPLMGLLDELFNDNSRAFRTMQARAAGRFPPVNVYLDETAAMVDVELPGRTAKDVALALEPQAVVVADKPEVPVDENGKPLQSWRVLILPYRGADAEVVASSGAAVPGERGEGECEVYGRHPAHCAAEGRCAGRASHCD